MSSIVGQKFDCVYSAHNIEHQINFVEHLNQVYALLDETGGKYLLVVPDKRYCFDHYVGETLLSDILDNYVNKNRKHTLRTLLQTCEATHNDVRLHWRGVHGFDAFDLERRSVECYAEKMRKYNETLDSEMYEDAHKWRFHPRSFAFIINSLQKMRLINFKLEKVYCTNKNSFEFMVVLNKE